MSNETFEEWYRGLIKIVPNEEPDEHINDYYIGDKLIFSDMSHIDYPEDLIWSRDISGVFRDGTIEAWNHQQKKIDELEFYKEQWQSIAGKANLKNLVKMADGVTTVKAILELKGEL